MNAVTRDPIKMLNIRDKHIPLLHNTSSVNIWESYFVPIFLYQKLLTYMCQDVSPCAQQISKRQFIEYQQADPLDQIAATWGRQISIYLRSVNVPHFLIEQEITDLKESLMLCWNKYCSRWIVIDDVKSSK